MPKPPKLYEFTVEGDFVFPFDMLRYDRCWPKTEATDVPNIGIHNTRVTLPKRQVTLVGLNPPTYKRWESFGWPVREEVIK